jgi:hypothetical protein
MRGTSFSSTTTSGSVPMLRVNTFAVGGVCRLLGGCLAGFDHAVHEGVIVRSGAEGASS